ncbi:MAG: Qat anti-phage system QueC-like protein QatC [Solirubrobacteraceae bacterium]
MTVVQVRVHEGQRVDGDADLVLDLYGSRRQDANVQWDSHRPALLKDLVPSAAASDFLRLGMSTFCVDKILLRKPTADAWTRDIVLRIPVHCREAFVSATPTIERALSFLSGDRWTLKIEEHPLEPPARTDSLLPPAADAVSLFSGGLDSLAGAIDQLVRGDRVVFVGHYDAGITPKRQRELFSELRTSFGSSAVGLRRLMLRPRPQGPRLHHRLPTGERERSTRARSLLFIAAGLAVADALDPRCPLVVPENGFIGINVPLTAARQGSLSTRTTHPHFVALVREILAALELDHELRNPYRLCTKGEILAANADPALLHRLALRSLSCSHPEATRHRTRKEGNCGYCWPCLIRRASMHHAGWDAHEQYIYDALADEELLEPDSKSGASLRAAVASLQRRATEFDVLRNGPVPAGEVPEFFDVYRRGRHELAVWLRTGAKGALLTRLPTA